MSYIEKYIIVGSRCFNNYYILYRTLQYYLPKDAIIVTGGASGADTLAEIYGNLNNHLVDVYYPKWDIYGKSAGMRRNIDMLGVANHVIAFWDGVSPGTKHILDIAQKKGIVPVVIDIYPEDILSPHPDLVVDVRKDNYDVYIGRGKSSVFGNPYRMSAKYNRLYVISAYIDYLMKTPVVLKEILTLKGKKLGCYCSPELCHGDAIVWLLEHAESEVKRLINGDKLEIVQPTTSHKSTGISLEATLKKFGDFSGPGQVYTTADLPIAKSGFSNIVEDDHHVAYIEISDSSFIKENTHLPLSERERLKENEGDITRKYHRSNDKNKIPIFYQSVDFADSQFKAGKWYVRSDLVHL